MTKMLRHHHPKLGDLRAAATTRAKRNPPLEAVAPPRPRTSLVSLVVDHGLALAGGLAIACVMGGIVVAASLRRDST